MLLCKNKKVQTFVFLLCLFVSGGTAMSGRNGVSSQLLVGPKGRSNHSCGWTLTHVQSIFNQIDQYCFYVLRVTWAHIISCTFQRPRCQNRANFALLIVICHPHLVGDNRKDRTDDIRPMCLGVVVPPFYMPYTMPYNMPCNTSLWFPALHRVRLSHWFRRKRRESRRSMVGSGALALSTYLPTKLLHACNTLHCAFIHQTFYNQ